MCHNTCCQFVKRSITPEEIEGKLVLEVGAKDFGGSVRPMIESFRPSNYVGVDIQSGKGVDEVCDVTQIVERFGAGSFDVIITTEMMEHVRYWREAVRNMKAVLKTNGLLVLTTRSWGWPFHAYPHDYWRYEVEDMAQIFSDFTIQCLESDTHGPGVFLKCSKEAHASEPDLDKIELYSIINNRRCHDVSSRQIQWFKFQYGMGQMLPAPLRQALKHRVLGRYT